MPGNNIDWTAVLNQANQMKGTSTTGTTNSGQTSTVSTATSRPTINAGIGASASQIANNIKNNTSLSSDVKNSLLSDLQSSKNIDSVYNTYNALTKNNPATLQNVTPQAVSNYSDNYVNAVQNSLNAKNKILDDYLNRYISLMNTFGNKNQRQIDNRLKGGLSGAMLTDQLNNRLNVQNNIANAVSQANSDKLANVDSAISRVENLYNTAKDDETLGRLSSFYKNLRG